MSGVIVLAHPLVLAVGFGAAASLQHTALGGKPLLDRYGGHLYVLLLFVPLAAVWYDRRGEGGLLSLFEPAEELPGGTIAVWLLGGAAIGVALFAVELWATRSLRSGAAERRTAQVLSVSGRTFLSLGAAAVLLEELIWRAYLVGFLHEQWNLAVGAAVVGAGAAFGANHLYFGARAFAFKSAHGVVWGVLLVASGLVWVPIASHAAFDLAVWYRTRHAFRRRNETSAGLRHA